MVSGKHSQRYRHGRREGGREWTRAGEDTDKRKAGIVWHGGRGEWGYFFRVRVGVLQLRSGRVTAMVTPSLCSISLSLLILSLVPLSPLLSLSLSKCTRSTLSVPRRARGLHYEAEPVGSQNATPCCPDADRLSQQTLGRNCVLSFPQQSAALTRGGA